MGSLGWLASCVVVLAIVHVTTGRPQGFNISEPGRQTTMYGQYFFAMLPLGGGVPDEGSILQIACVSCSSSQATGSITLLGEDISQSFVANPTTSVLLSAFAPFSSNDTAVLNITSDWDITVAVLIKRGGTLSAYTVIPVASLDIYYPVVSYGLPEDNLSELTVVAVEPHTITDVSFKPQAANVTVNNQVVHSSMGFSLGTGEWVSYKTHESFSGGGLSCTNPVAGLVETRCESPQQGCPYSLHELYPLVSIGTRYTAVPAGDRSTLLNNVFRVVAIWENTEISVSSGRHSTKTYQSTNVTLNSGQAYDWSTTDLTDVQGSKPFLLLHHVQKGTPVVDTAVVMVPPVQQLTRQTLTFNTYDGSNLEEVVKNYITITAHCKDFGNIQLQETTKKTATSWKGLKRSTGEFCGYSASLDAGTYRIGPSIDEPLAAYSAILYGFTDTGIFAYILATELDQLICRVDGTQVILCPPIATTQASLSTATTESFTTPGKKQTHNSGTIIAVVISIIIILAGSLIAGFILYRYCKGRQWRRLDEAEYMEDNPIRLQVIDQDGHQSLQL